MPRTTPLACCWQPNQWKLLSNHPSGIHWKIDADEAGSEAATGTWPVCSAHRHPSPSPPSGPSSIHLFRWFQVLAKHQGKEALGAATLESEQLGIGAARLCESVWKEREGAD